MTENAPISNGGSNGTTTAQGDEKPRSRNPSPSPRQQQPADAWTTNPYPITHPRHLEYKVLQHEAVVERHGRDSSMLRLKDFTRENRQSHERSFALSQEGGGSRSVSPSTLALTSPMAVKPAACCVSQRPAASASQQQQQLTARVVLFGGTITWDAYRDGSIVVRNNNNNNSGGSSSNENAQQQQAEEVTRLTLQSTQHGDDANSAAFVVTMRSLSKAYVLAISSRAAAHVFDVLTMQQVASLPFEPAASASFERKEDVLLVPLNQSDAPLDEATDLDAAVIDTRTHWISVLTFSPPHNRFHDLRFQLTCSLSRQFPSKTLGSQGVCFTAATALADTTALFLGDDHGRIWHVDLNDLQPISHIFVSLASTTTAVTALAACHGDKWLLAADRNGGLRLLEVSSKSHAYHHYHTSSAAASSPVSPRRTATRHTPRVIHEFATDRAHRGAPISRVLVDSFNNRFWTVSDNSCIAQWSLDPLTSFECCRTLSLLGDEAGQQKDVAVVSCEEYVHADSMSLWTLATSGINGVWYTEFVRAECDVDEALKAMQIEVQRESRELEKWNLSLAQARHNLSHRVNTAVRAIARSAASRTMREAYWRLFRYRQLRRTHGKLRPIAVALDVTLVQQLRSRFYLRWLLHRRKHRSAKLGDSRAGTLLALNQRRALLRTFLLWHAYLRRVAHKAHMLRKERVLVTMVNSMTARRSYRIWKDYFDQGKRIEKRRSCIAVMAKNIQKRLVMRYFARWLQHSRLYHAERYQTRSLEIVSRLATTVLRRSYFCQLRKFARRAKVRSAFHSWSCTLQRREQTVAHRCFSRWSALVRKISLSHVQKAVSEQKAVHDGVLEEETKLRPRLQKAQELQEFRDKLQALLDKKQQREELQKTLQESVQHARDDSGELFSKSNNTSDRNEFAAVMLRIKNRSINYDTDAPFIQKVVEKAPSGPIAAKQFMTLLASVQRSLLSPLPEGSYSPPNAWPIGNDEAAVRRHMLKIAPEHHALLVTNIKTMAVLFDLMSAIDLNQLNIDVAVATNGKFLLICYDALASIVTKRRNTAMAQK